MKDLNKELLDTMRDFSSKIGSIQEQSRTQAETNMKDIDDPRMKEFLECSLKDAMDNNLSSVDFMDKFKDIQDGRG